MKVHLEVFDELARQLHADGLPAAAESISDLRKVAWSTSSEMMGELGIAVLKIQAETPSPSRALQEILGRCMAEVRKIWPDMELP
jgi:hypothetical protein